MWALRARERKQPDRPKPVLHLSGDNNIDVGVAAGAVGALAFRQGGVWGYLPLPHATGDRALRTYRSPATGPM